MRDVCSILCKTQSIQTIQGESYFLKLLIFGFVMAYPDGSKQGKP